MAVISRLLAQPPWTGFQAVIKSAASAASPIAWGEPFWAFFGPFWAFFRIKMEATLLKSREIRAVLTTDVSTDTHVVC